MFYRNQYLTEKTLIRKINCCVLAFKLKLMLKTVTKLLVRMNKNVNDFQVKLKLKEVVQYQSWSSGLNFWFEVQQDITSRISISTAVWEKTSKTDSSPYHWFSTHLWCRSQCQSCWFCPCDLNFHHLVKWQHI